MALLFHKEIVLLIWVLFDAYDVKERVGCDNISDLPYRKRAVWEEIKRLSPTAYPKEQLEKFSHYVFGVDYAVIMGILEMKKGSDTSCREWESTC